MSTAENQDKLSPLRRRIDELDQKIVELLNQRAGIVIQIGKIKQTDGSPIYAPDREQQILERIRKLNQGPLTDACMEAIWR